MSYLVLARKWRPRQFSSVVAQQHVTRTIENAIKQNRLASAYLFSGPRGVGKTTMARLLAKAVNCEKGPTPTPCDECANCQEISGGRSIDVIEIDGASNRGIDEVRSLRDNARFAPASSLKKIYIIDEVHMLTEQAFNALLKILEEPPSHVLFLFATTEIHKVPATILSRCQRFDFRRVPVADIVSQLRMICENEGVHADEASLYLIARRAEGSMRDSQSLLDQTISFCGNQISKDEISRLFGIIDQELFFRCTDAIIHRNAAQMIQIADEIHSSGLHLGEFFERLAEHLSLILTSRITGDSAHLAGMEAYAGRYSESASTLDELALLQYIQIVSEAQAKLARASSPRILLETALLRMVHLGKDRSSSPVSGPKESQASSAGKEKTPKPAAQTMASEQESAEPTSRMGIALVPEVNVRKSAETEAPAQQAKTNGGLFHDSRMPAVKGVPVVRAKEATSPLSGHIEDEETALQAVQNCWHSVIEAVKSQRISLGTFLELGRPTALREGVLEVSFGNGNGFHIHSVNNQKTLIQQSIQSQTGYSVRIICRIDDKVHAQPAAPAAKSVPAEVPRATPPVNGAELHGPKAGTSSNLKELFEHYPVVKKFVEAVDGELIRAHANR